MDAIMIFARQQDMLLDSNTIRQSKTSFLMTQNILHIEPYVYKYWSHGMFYMLKLYYIMFLQTNKSCGSTLHLETYKWTKQRHQRQQGR